MALDIRTTKIDPTREYVIICNEHSGMWAGAMLFWGSLTEDNSDRSFGGYTTDANTCERYTLDEIRKFSHSFPVYQKGMTVQEFLEARDIIIRPGDLADLGMRNISVWYRP